MFKKVIAKEYKYTLHPKIREKFCKIQQQNIKIAKNIFYKIFKIASFSTEKKSDLACYFEGGGTRAFALVFGQLKALLRYDFFSKYFTIKHIFASSAAAWVALLYAQEKIDYENQEKIVKIINNHLNPFDKKIRAIINHCLFDWEGDLVFPVEKILDEIIEQGILDYKKVAKSETEVIVMVTNQKGKPQQYNITKMVREALKSKKEDLKKEILYKVKQILIATAAIPVLSNDFGLLEKDVRGYDGELACFVPLKEMEELGYKKENIMVFSTVADEYEFQDIPRFTKPLINRKFRAFPSIRDAIFDSHKIHVSGYQEIKKLSEQNEITLFTKPAGFSVERDTKDIKKIHQGIEEAEKTMFQVLQDLGEFLEPKHRQETREEILADFENNQKKNAFFKKIYFKF